MTGSEIIALARTHFGEDSPVTLTEQQAVDFLNTALMELFNDLAPERMRNRVSSNSVTLTAGQGDIPNTWDRILEVYVDDIPCVPVERNVISSIDNGGDYFVPSQPVCHVDESHVWVRPSGTTTIVHLTAPAPLTLGGLSAEVTAFAAVWHPSLALLTASYMYAQEEDGVQASHYRSEYVSSLTNINTLMSQGAEAWTSMS